MNEATARRALAKLTAALAKCEADPCADAGELREQAIRLRERAYTATWRKCTLDDGGATMDAAQAIVTRASELDGCPDRRAVRHASRMAAARAEMPAPLTGYEAELAAMFARASR